MSTVAHQLEALTKIRVLIEKHFPDTDPYWIVDDRLAKEIQVEHNQEIDYSEEEKRYVLTSYPECKVCRSTASSLKEIPTQSGHFFLCHSCFKTIIQEATPLMKG